ncbi:PAS domain S-box-containing protein [Halanaerobium saccharolyticum]|uniref:PAS domain S-box-containing protein n=1 Tax=Halanaerobium saccharolyticum TaxID=43595 RepID=A0A4R7YYK5_9FIRM|nr:PAS domain S-box protein [Halanaerobium saccharolyticum]RAK08957.1 PAS domain S-box-containing protein [Halanaerobium saccharolyticum]TDW02649.1 PAS domain S-box-containing protein [Halanaerobium saccharolyticum]TDX60720.1 PAS domain S-box-containing protein [Halanaerobium saccharolyticum]
MIKDNRQSSGFILKIDGDSQIKEVIFNSLEKDLNFENKNFSQFIDQGSLKKYFSLLKESNENDVVFGREINLNFAGKSEAYIFIMLNNLENDNILIAANQSEGIIKYYEELMKINNNYVNNLRSSIKDRIAEEKPVSDDEIYNEMSRLNNELVNTKRELNKKNLLLKAEKEKYKITLASIAEGVITADQDDLIVYLNAKAEELLGWSQKEAAGKKCSEIFRVLIEKNRDYDLEIISDEIKEADEHKNNLSKLLAEKGEINNQEAVLTSKMGRHFPIEFSAAFVEETGGKVIIFREISQRKDMEKRLKKYASTDRLTEVLNRRAGLEYLKEEMETAEAA